MGCKLSRSASQEDVTRVKQSGGRGNKNRKRLFGSKQERRADAPSSEEEDIVGGACASVVPVYGGRLDAPVGPPIGRHVGPANSVLSRRDTPAGGLLLDSLSNGNHDGRPGDSTTTSALHTNFQDRLISSGVAACTKPIGSVSLCSPFHAHLPCRQSMESESQADFFRMLDAKIAHVRKREWRRRLVRLAHFRAEVATTTLR
jgi:hypothetical protein